MQTIAIISQKGGAGKTTLALNLAVASDLAGKFSAVVDLDPQASATGWSDSREAETPVVVSAQPSRLLHVLDTAKQGGANLVVIDTSPHSENAALIAARAADLVLIPCRPAILDLRAIGSTVDVARLAQVPAIVVLNAVPSRGTLPEEAATAIEGYGVEICPVRIGQRMAYVHALTAGQSVQEYESDGKAAEEIKKLHKFISAQTSKRKSELAHKLASEQARA